MQRVSFEKLRDPSINLLCQILYIFFSIKIAFAFGQKMDWTRCPEFAVNFRIATNKTFLAHVYIVLHTGIAGFPVRVIYAVSQSHIS
jgi:hypothetical protein